MKVIGYRISPISTAITFEDGTPVIVSNGHPNFAEIVRRLPGGDHEGLLELTKPIEAVKRFLGGRAEITGTSIKIDGNNIENAVVPVILNMVQNDEDPEHLLNFLDNLVDNPSFNSRRQLWNFIERNGITIYGSDEPITSRHGIPFVPKGWLVLYKGVNSDLTDCHTGKIDNTPGAWPPAMNRSEVDDDPNSACSTGYHAGAYKYVQGFGTRKLVVLVDPADVVSVPHDSSAQKVRVTEYYVLKEITPEQVTAFKSSVYVPDFTYNVSGYNSDGDLVREQIEADSLEEASDEASDLGIVEITSITRE